MRTIDADALKNIHGMKDDCAECDKELMHKSRSCEFDRVYTLMDFCGWIDDAPTIEPERKKGTPLLEKREWIDGYENRWYRKKFYCASCGIKIRTESWNGKRCFGEGTILKDNNMPNFCPNCGADIREEQDGKSD